MFVSTGIFKNGSEWGGFVWVDRQRWQWQPSTTSHDPSPPITLEDAAVAAPSAISRRTLSLIGTRIGSRQAA